MDKNSYEIRLCELISASLECCLAAVSFAWSFISPLALVHPFPLRGPSPQGETRRDGTPLLLLKHAKYSAELATFGGSPPLIPLCRTPPQRGNDSLHFARRYRSFKMCSLCIHGKACHTILRLLCSLTARLSPTHNILRVTAFLHPLLSLTHWIFGSLMLPYKSSSHSAKYVRWCDSCSLATPSGGQNKPLYVPPQSHVARW